MSTLKTTNLQNASAASPAFVLASDGSATANLSSLNGGPIAGTRNRIINGDMRIDQRNAGAAVTAGSAYTLDRWNVDRTWTGSTTTIQRSTTAATGFTNSLLATVSTGAAAAAASYFSIQQYLEGFNFADLGFGAAGASSFTVSFWVRSSVTGAYGIGFRNSAFNLSYWTTYTVNSANTWEQKSVTIPGATSGTWYTDNSYGINLIFSLGCGSTEKAASNNAWNSGSKLGAVGQTDLIATTGATFYITGVQLEPGTVATPFERRSFGQELALCQRYYQRFNNIYAEGYSSGSTVRQNTPMSFPVQMRTTPTRTVITAGSYTNIRSSSSAYAGLGLNGFTDSYASCSMESAAAGYMSMANQSESMSSEL